MVLEYMLALGSNLGNGRDNPLETITLATQELAHRSCSLRRVSRLFSTPCFPAGAGPDYINACIRVTYDGPPAQMLSLLHRIEADFGRERQQRWGSRTLDLDLLACGQSVLPSDQTFSHWHSLPLEDQKIRAPQELILPHPRLHERAFVLVPLCDIAAEWVHPVLGKSVREMTKGLPADLCAQVVPL